jgi:hypothetical protein
MPHFSTWNHSMVKPRHRQVAAPFVSVISGLKLGAGTEGSAGAAEGNGLILGVANGWNIGMES